jgi:hypothetical protein
LSHISLLLDNHSSTRPFFFQDINNKTVDQSHPDTVNRPILRTTIATTQDMAVIWGLDLKEMQWGKFKNSYMWNKEYHLRRTKFIVYQLAMIFCVVSESLGTAALSGMHDPSLISPYS